MEVFTIGVYGKTESAFFGALEENSIGLFIDIRQRRAVMGATYSFVNSTRLQKKLATLGIGYMHVLELAPTKEIRALQEESDAKAGIPRRERSTLTSPFVRAYQTRILDKFDMNSFIDELTRQGTRSIVFFCVEATAQACHRSLVAQKITRELGIEVRNL